MITNKLHNKYLSSTYIRDYSNLFQLFLVASSRSTDIKVTFTLSGFGGLEVVCWPLVPKFAGSNPAEAVGFFRAKKSSARLPSEGK